MGIRGIGGGGPLRFPEKHRFQLLGGRWVDPLNFSWKNWGVGSVFTHPKTPMSCAKYKIGIKMIWSSNSLVFFWKRSGFKKLEIFKTKKWADKRIGNVKSTNHAFMTKIYANKRSVPKILDGWFIVSRKPQWKARTNPNWTTRSSLQPGSTDQPQVVKPPTLTISQPLTDSNQQEVIPRVH